MSNSSGYSPSEHFSRQVFSCKNGMVEPVDKGKQERQKVGSDVGQSLHG